MSGVPRPLPSEGRLGRLGPSFVRQRCSVVKERGVKSNALRVGPGRADKAQSAPALMKRSLRNSAGVSHPVDVWGVRLYLGAHLGLSSQRRADRPALASCGLCLGVHTVWPYPLRRGAGCRFVSVVAATRDRADIDAGPNGRGSRTTVVHRPPTRIPHHNPRRKSSFVLLSAPDQADKHWSDLV
jgi:hypothetical protein